MAPLIPIGQFAALTGLSPKALRLYGDRGLLLPARVDDGSGYRYYDPGQLRRAELIALLRRAGVALRDIAGFLADPDVARVHEWERLLADDFQRRKASLQAVARLLGPPTKTRQEDHQMTETATSIRLMTGIPVLASLNLPTTVEFYGSKLGFSTLATYDDYAIVRRDDVELHFWLCDDADIPRQTSCRVRTKGIEALYEDYRHAGVIHPNGHLEEKPWGAQFAVLDGDGNLLVFIAAR